MHVLNEVLLTAAPCCVYSVNDQEHQLDFVEDAQAIVYPNGAQ